MALSVETKFERAMKTLTSIAQELCDSPVFTTDDSGKPVVLRCNNQTAADGYKFTGELLCSSCQAREALKELKD